MYWPVKKDDGFQYGPFEVELVEINVSENPNSTRAQTLQICSGTLYWWNVYTGICVDIYDPANGRCLCSGTAHHSCLVCFSDIILSQIGHSISSQNKDT